MFINNLWNFEFLSLTSCNTANTSRSKHAFKCVSVLALTLSICTHAPFDLQCRQKFLRDESTYLQVCGDGLLGLGGQQQLDRASAVLRMRSMSISNEST